MPSRQVVLIEHHVALIDELVRSGRYQDADEVVREGLRLLEQREARDAAKLAALRAAILEGLEAFERGEYVEFDSVDELSAYLDQLADDVLRETATRTGG